MKKRIRSYWTIDQIEFLKENYKILSYKEISDKINKSTRAISKKALELNIGWQTRKKWNPLDILYLKENYIHLSYAEIALYLSRSRQSVARKAFRLGINRDGAVSLTSNITKEDDIRDLKLKYLYKTLEIDQPKNTKIRVTDKNGRTYSINENYFSEWSKDMAYILGFIVADGSISKNGQRLTIILQKQDKYILEKIRDKISPLTPVIEDKPRNIFGKLHYQCSVRFNSVKLCSDLYKLGVYPNKSLEEKWPSNMPTEYTYDFIRGFMDGDGGLRQENGSIFIYFCGSQFLIKELSDKINENFPNKIKILVRKRKSINKKELYLNSIIYTKIAEPLLDHIYEPINKKISDLYLPRKYEKYIHYKLYKYKKESDINWNTHITGKPIHTFGKCIEYNGQFHYTIEWSKILNIPYNTIRSRFRNGWSIEKTFTTPIQIKNK